MKLPHVILKAKREKSVLNRHPWIFSGGIARMPECEDGALVQVKAHDGSLLGSGYFNSKSSITVRLLAFGDEDPIDALLRHLEMAVTARSNLGLLDTNAYRLVNGEGDFLPGLVVDRYGDVLVVQVGTSGMDRLLPPVLESLIKQLAPRCIFEKSLSQARKEEGLDPKEQPLFGPEPESVQIREYGHHFLVSFRESQKTGFFLDQREMRAFVGQASKDRRVLNCFSYTGGFSVYAAKAGASHVESVDISKDAIERAKENFTQNHLPLEPHRFEARDAFEHLREKSEPFDVVILDPPAFAKKRTHVVQACRGYSDINREGLRKVAVGGLLVTSSCSHFVDEKLFQQVVFQAARDAGREVQVLGGHRQAFDHPVSIFHPEGSYLKSLILRVAA